jgi:hypothetical protein
MASTASVELAGAAVVEAGGGAIGVDDAAADSLTIIGTLA